LNPIHQPFSWRASGLVLIAWCFLPLSFVIPELNSNHPPFFNLQGWVASMALGFSHSAGKFGLPLVLLVGLVGLVLDIEQPRFTRMKLLLSALALSLLMIGTGSYVNEHWTKTQFEIPRPNIGVVLMSQKGEPVVSSAEAFYQSGHKSERSAVLAKVLEKSTVSDHISAGVKQHWVAETGYSFPSGHSFAAFFCASFLFLLGFSYARGASRVLLIFILPWAVLVAYSRTVLLVHSPLDICVGGLVGMLWGLLAVKGALVLWRIFMPRKPNFV